MSLRRLRIAILCFAVSTAVGAQPLKNVQVLTGLTRTEIQRVMNQMRAGLGVHCHYCHANDHGESDAKPQKVRAREMMRMVIDLNARHFGGQPVVTCYTCHNGKPHPALTPPLPQPIPPEPVAAEAPSLPALAAIIEKYVTAVGRERSAEGPWRFRGTHKSPNGPRVPITIVRIGDKWRGDITMPDGTIVTQAFDARGGWRWDASGVRDLTPEELLAARTGWRPFAPFDTSAIREGARVIGSETIGERKTWVVATANARYWFDAERGFLLRRVVEIPSVVGRMPEQTDFDDYRDAGGGKLPFLIRVALVDPWSGGTRQAETIEAGAEIPPGEFEKPSPPG